MSKSKTAGLVFLIFIIAVFLRVYRLPELPPGLYPDEAMNGSNAFEAIATGQYEVYYPENNGREGLFMNIQAQFLRVLVPWNNGLPEPWMLRLASTIFGSLTVLGLYFLGKELFSKRVGLIASFLMATSFWHINFSRIGFRAITAPFFLVWGIYFLILAIRKGREGRGGAWVMAAILGGIVYGLGFYSYIAYRVSPLLLLLLIPFFRKSPGFWKIAFLFVLVTFVTALPIGLYYLHNPADFLGRTSQVSIFSLPSPAKELGLNILKTVGMFFVAGDFNERHNLSGRPELFVPVALFFLVGIIWSLRKTFHRVPKPEPVEIEEQAPDPQAKINPFMWGATKKPVANLGIEEFDVSPRFGPLLVLLWFLFMMLPVVISNEGLPHALRAIVMIPPTMLLAALGAVWLYEWITHYGWVRMANVGVLLIALLLTGQAYYQYFVEWANNPDTPGAFAANYVDVSRAVRALPNDVPKYIFVDAGGVLVRGIPMPAQTVMYMTDSFTPDKQQEKNIHYVLPADQASVPPGAVVFYIR